MNQPPIGPPLRIATRGSALALAQARLAAEALSAVGLQCETVIVETEGDRRAPDTAWGEGAFVKAIELALLERRADLAVHSAKDVPTDEDPRLRICAYLPREDPLDVLVVRVNAGQATLDNLPAGSVIGTDSPRRAGFLRSLRPELVVRPLHGNVDTRLRRLDEGEVDALVLAAAGLRRLGLEERISQRIPAEQLPPAPGQGALAIQLRADDTELIGLVGAVDDQPTRAAVEAEREFLRASGGGCRSPIGALAWLADGRLHLLGGYADELATAALVEQLAGSPEERRSLAGQLARQLLARRDGLARAPRVLLTRPPEQSQRLAHKLAGRGIRGLSVPAIQIVTIDEPDGLADALDRLRRHRRVVVTSVNGVRGLASLLKRARLAPADLRWATVGRSTATALRDLGAREIWLPSSADGATLGRELPIEAGDGLLLARGELADDRLPRLLRERGAQVDELVVYRTQEAPEASRPLLAEALEGGGLEAVILASPSAVRGTLELAGNARGMLLTLPAICIGPTTAAAAREAGFTILGRATSQDAESLAELTATLLERHRARVPA